MHRTHTLPAAPSALQVARVVPPARLTLAPPHRLDIGVVDLLRALVGGAAIAHDEGRTRAALEASFAPDCVAFLSVRSSLCALLQASGWQPGDEVLVSAITITDMPRVIEAHGFVPVPVDVDPRTMAPDLDDLRRKIGPRTRAVIVAQLFGGRCDLQPIADVAHAHGLLVVEDCAQAFAGPSWLGHGCSDVVMFSFGTLKTTTALGGALVRVVDPALRARMRAVQDAWPAQATSTYAKKVVKCFAFLAAQLPLVYGLLAHALALFGRSLGEVVRSATRGFPAKDADDLVTQLEHRPCAALLWVLADRLRRFDHGAAQRLARRTRAGELLRARFPERVYGAHASTRSHWLLPLSSRQGDDVKAALWAIGVDASGASNLTAVGDPAQAVRAQRLVHSVVFVPAYPELGAGTLARIADAVEGVGERTAVDVAVEAAC